jgi:hypothetical protein
MMREFKTKKPRVLYYAEALREVGILAMVFGPLYVVFDGRLEDWHNLSLVWKWPIGGALAFFIGVELERKFQC